MYANVVDAETLRKNWPIRFWITLLQAAETSLTTKAMTIKVYSCIHTTPSSTTSYRHNTIWYWNLCTPYRIRNSGNNQWHTCRFKYSKHFYPESLTSRELRWLEPDKSCSCYFIEVVFHYVVSPRITIKDLETKVAAALSIPIPNHIMIWRT